MTSRLPSLCDSCKHLRSNGSTCAAYPIQIPEDIRVWAGDHHEVRPDQDNTTVWGMRKGARAELQEWKLLRS